MAVRLEFIPARDWGGGGEKYGRLPPLEPSSRVIRLQQMELSCSWERFSGPFGLPIAAAAACGIPAGT